MDLHLPEFDPAGAKIITCTIEGILEEDDIHAILAGRVGPAESGSSNSGGHSVPVEVDDPRSLKRIKERHHSVARLIASGVSQTLVAQFSGYDEQYLSVLLNNPAMTELITLYRIEYGKSSEIIAEKLRSVGTQALERIEERIPSMDDNALVQTAKLGLDRSGHGPTSTVNKLEEKHIIDHAEIARLNIEARRQSASYIVPVNEVRKSLPTPEKETSDEPQ